jgi:hypothetical protein
VRAIVTDCFPIEESLQAFKHANERQGLKIVVIP